ncbi:hypothetical protein A3844_26890 [Paenibacillus helianthi]|uniref:Aminoglycoside phosphotransferase domain-containing protein n=1 Tax=Paenibacillus helianthi TaxID=1349432 RepID=A0ABX3EGR0_9BACL|nr:MULTISPECIES: phosphotransferase [Paenibacillus]OKP80712.1 hypothetical protein A3844_26890 [Paenibacillus helianthi]OKP89122.1 hypothetical protein A3848_16600 [Paenibacillus sp. P32E]
MKELLRQLYGVKYTDVKLHSQRHFNDIFQFQINGCPKVIKMSRNRFLKEEQIGSDSLHKEAHILRKLEATDLPVPKVECVGYLGNQEYLIMQQMKGVPIGSVFWDIEPSQRARLITELLQYLKQVHSMKVVDFFPDEKKSVADSLLAKLHEYQYERPNSSYRKAINYLIHSMSCVFPNPYEPDSLLHSDLGPQANNILVEKHKGNWFISAILDWERCRFGDPVEELCRLEFELAKSWMHQSLCSTPYVLNDLLNLDLLKEYAFVNVSEDILDWYRQYTTILPTRWYLKSYKNY